MNKCFKYFLVLGFISALPNSYAQEFDDDAALWLNLYLEKKLNDKFDAHLSHSSRINNNVSEYGLGYADIGLTYNPSKSIKVMGDYVYGLKKSLDGSYANRHRAYLAVILKKEIGKWTFAYRNRFQMQMTDIYSSENGLVPKYYERNKGTVKYDINKRYTAYVAEELYYPLYQAKNKGFDRSRSIIGLQFNISKKAYVEGYFIYQHELNAYDRTRRDFIYGIGYSREF